MTKSRVWTMIDFDVCGVQSDFARVPYSSDTSAYGWLPIPMLCLKGGDGPTALLTAGTHGDEYEGQVALLRLARELAGMELQGRVIILPALNQPAVAVGRRNSPLDGGNLNRLFPGDPEGGPTAMIAHYVASELFPRANLVIDVHSGGSSLDHLPVALARPGTTETLQTKIRRLIMSFGAPIGVITSGAGGGAGSTLYAAAEAAGIPALTTELGSGATLSAEGLSMAENGVRRVLCDYGIATGLAPEPGQKTRLMKSLGPAGGLYAPCAGLFEPFVVPGAEVRTSQPAGLLHRMDDPLAAPVELTFRFAGMVTWRRFLTLTAPGDALFGLMSDI